MADTQIQGLGIGAEFPVSRPKSQSQGLNPNIKDQTPASRKKSQPEGFAGFELFLMAQISASWQKSHVGPKSQPFGPNCPNCRS